MAAPRSRIPGSHRSSDREDRPSDVSRNRERSRTRGCAMSIERQADAMTPASTRIPTRVIGQDVAEVPDTSVACVQEIETDAGRVRVPRGGNEVLKTVKENGHVHLRDRRAARREQRVPVRGPEIPNLPAHDLDMERSTAGSSEGGRVSGLRETTEVKVRE